MTRNSISGLLDQLVSFCFAILETLSKSSQDCFLASCGELTDSLLNWDISSLIEKLEYLEKTKQKTILLGVSYALLDLIEGRIDPSSFNPAKIKYRLIQEGYIQEECTSCCFHERRVLDYKMPLIMHFRDGNKQHYRLENIQLLCYNCYYLQIGDLFTGKQLEGMEDHVSKNESKVDWEVDDYTAQRLKELGLYDSTTVFLVLFQFLYIA